jgi:GNAT superfamily N-acetyltransferase
VTARLRELREADVADGLRLSRLAGWNQREEDWRALLRLNPGRFVAAEHDGRVIGTGGAAVYGSALAWICMILVDPEHRGAGVGTRMMEALLERCADVARVGLDATPLGQPVYERLGFVATEVILRMSRAENAEAAPEGGSAVEVRDLPDALLAEDRFVFGADRGGALRWLATHGRAFVAGPGYTFVRPGAHSSHVGPLVARDLATAEALVAAALAASGPGPVIIDARAADADWVACLQRLGFVEKRRLARMYRDPGPPHVPRGGDVRAIFGPEFG